MDDTAPTLNAVSPLLWGIVLASAWLAGHLGLAFTRAATRRGARARTLLLAAAAVLSLGGMILASMVMAVAGEPVAYPIGYRASALAAAWALALLAAAGLLLPVGWKASPASTAVSAALFAACATASQATLLRAAGLLPGLAWRFETLGVAVVLQAALAAAALWLAFVGPGREGRHRRRWRAAAAAVLALALLAGPSVVLAAADLASQIGSAYSDHVGAQEATLLAAVVVPGLLLALAGVLHLGVGDVPPAGQPDRRRRRRRRWWAMRP
jgi:hypothetical protein